jgi:plasmid stabilization system protein ParE
LLDEAHDYIAAENPTGADRVVADIRTRVDQLAEQPGLGFKSTVRLSTQQIREIFVAPYRVLYRIDSESNRLLVLLIWHASRRNPRRKDFVADP